MSGAAREPVLPGFDDADQLWLEYPVRGRRFVTVGELRADPGLLSDVRDMQRTIGVGKVQQAETLEKEYASGRETALEEVKPYVDEAQKLRRGREKGAARLTELNAARQRDSAKRHQEIRDAYSARKATPGAEKLARVVHVKAIAKQLDASPTTVRRALGLRTKKPKG
jgi:uncharacterized coiled-coil DUF342 family protein